MLMCYISAATTSRLDLLTVTSVVRTKLSSKIPLLQRSF